jgi:3-phosphoshikimate 1-carboxyvinyltransferase
MVGGPITLNSKVSSQFLSALFIMAPFLLKGLRTTLREDQVSRPYLNMTIKMMKDFGIQIDQPSNQEVVILPQQNYKKSHYWIEGDYSQSSYFFALSALKETSICLKGLALPENSLQGDREIISLYHQMGGKTIWDHSDLHILAPSKFKGQSFDLSQISDLAPTLAVMGLWAEGKTELKNMQHIQFKESNRQKAIYENLNHLIPGSCCYTEDGLIIYGYKEKLRQLKEPRRILCYGDHRMAMAFGVLKEVCPFLEIDDPTVVSKTYPHFFDDIAKTR